MASRKHEVFRERMQYLLEDEGTVASIPELVSRYWGRSPTASRYTGPQFDRFRDVNRPNEITEMDMVAVSMLSVTVPPRAAIWMLSDGRGQIRELLERVPPDADFRTHAHLLGADGALQQLWDLLKRASWPEPDRANHMGTTKISKLIAAKRPRLAPIFDSVVRELLGPVDDCWVAFRHALDDATLTRWEELTASAPADIPLLRKIDSALWMLGTTSIGDGVAR